jgi:hypothetical protein
VVAGLPSIWFGEESSGPHDVTFDTDGQMYVIIGLGELSPEDRARFGEAGALLGTIVRVDGPGEFTVIADLVEYEFAVNPDGGVPDSNPYAIDFDGTHLIAVDAGGNSLLRVHPGTGDIELITTFPTRMTPAPPFIPVDEMPMESVPTHVVVGPDGNYYVVELTGFPFTVGAAQVYRVTPGGDRDIVATGFTNLGALGFDSAGRLIVLEIVTVGFLNMDFEAIEEGDVSTAASRIVRIEADGSHTVLPSPGIFFATGLAIGAGDELYVVNLAVTPGAHLVRIDLLS